MDFYDRFRREISSADVELAISLPIFTAKEETIFFYSTKPGDGEFFLINELNKVCRRDLSTGEITTITPEMILSPAQLSRLRNSRVAPTVFGDEAMDAEDLYLEYYERILPLGFRDQPTQSERALLCEIRRLFLLLVPPSALRDLYFLVGREYFDYLDRTCDV